MAGFNCFFILTLFIALLVSGGQAARNLLQFPSLPSFLNLLFENAGQPVFLKKLIFFII
jgi:hypothetical protein